VEGLAWVLCGSHTAILVGLVAQRVDEDEEEWWDWNKG
jgi:hypothetical protein